MKVKGEFRTGKDWSNERLETSKKYERSGNIKGEGARDALHLVPEI